MSEPALKKSVINDCKWTFTEINGVTIIVICKWEKKSISAIGQSTSIKK